MRAFYQRVAAMLTPGVGFLLALWIGLFLTSRFYPLRDWLALSGPAVWHGQVWRLASYAALPASWPDLLMSSIALVWFGGTVERFWRAGEFLLYCLVAAAGAGLVKVALQYFSPGALLGPGPVCFALLAAYARLCAQDAVMRQTVILFAVISVLLLGSVAGVISAVIALSGGACGLGYLWLRSEWRRPRGGQNAVSQRISRLEL
ncbi:MAG: rhomboid family intramembrane serine protease [Verrucomicrobiota bacterium]|jgi:membrane associated rhomboid family serine protease